jgi:hypothetical protein
MAMIIVTWLMAKVWSMEIPPFGLACVSVWKEERQSIANRTAANMSKIAAVKRNVILSHREFISHPHEI